MIEGLVENMLICETEELNEENTTHQSTDGAANNVISIKFSKLLTKEQEYELGRKALLGDIEARNELVNANYGLVAKIAHDYEGGGVPFEDLFQEGCIGLITAASKFDPDQNCRFSTYAIIWIKKYIRRSSIRSGFSTKIPRRIEPYINRVLSFSRLFETTNGREPSIAEISENTSISPNIIEDVLRFSKPLSEYDDRLNSHDSTRPDLTISHDGEFVLADIMKEELEKIFELVLSEEEKYILRARFYSDTRITKKEISSLLDITVPQIINIEKRAYRKVRKYFADNNIDFHNFL